jgi:hypothetical protein
MDVEKFRQKFLGAARLYNKMNADSNCCKWEKFRGDLFQAAVSECLKYEIGDEGFSEKDREQAVLIASAEVAKQKVEALGIGDVKGLRAIYNPIARTWLKDLNEYALNEVMADNNAQALAL